jgi:hypothetical protein
MIYNKSFNIFCGLVAVVAAAAAGSGYSERRLAPLLKPTGDVIPNSYIVVLHDSLTAAGRETLERNYGGAMTSLYSEIIKGYSATLDETALNQLRRNPNVSVS